MTSYKCQEFFKAIKKVGKRFEWTLEYEEAFQKIKEHLGSPPLLYEPEGGGGPHYLPSRLRLFYQCRPS